VNSQRTDGEDAGIPAEPLSRRSKGTVAERLAAVYLEERGYQLVDRNVYLHVGEIDLVTEKDGLTVLVEVRSRHRGDLGSPLWSLTRAKQHRMRLAAERFLQAHPELPQEARIDLVAITFDGRGRVSACEIVENAVEGTA